MANRMGDSFWIMAINIPCFNKCISGKTGKPKMIKTRVQVYEDGEIKIVNQGCYKCGWGK
jgi:hypothetical protein